MLYALFAAGVFFLRRASNGVLLNSRPDRLESNRYPRADRATLDESPAKRKRTPASPRQTSTDLGSQVGGEKEACQNGYLPESLVAFARVFPAESL